MCQRYHNCGIFFVFWLSLLLPQISSSLAGMRPFRLLKRAVGQRGQVRPWQIGRKSSQGCFFHTNNNGLEYSLLGGSRPKIGFRGGCSFSSSTDTTEVTSSSEQDRSEYENWVRKLYMTNMFNPVKLGLENIDRLHSLLGSPMDDVSRKWTREWWWCVRLSSPFSHRIHFHFLLKSQKWQWFILQAPMGKEAWP